MTPEGLKYRRQLREFLDAQAKHMEWSHREAIRQQLQRLEMNLVAIKSMVLDVTATATVSWVFIPYITSMIAEMNAAEEQIERFKEQYEEFL